MNNIIKNEQKIVLNFFTEQVHLCIDLKYVYKVIPIAKLARIPKSPEYFAGMLNLAGKSIPIIDFDIRLGLARKNLYILNNKIILFEYKNKNIGIIVDKIIGLETLFKDDFQKNETNDDNSFFKGTVIINDELLYFININYLFDIFFSNEIGMSIP